MAKWFHLRQYGKRTITPVEVVKETPEYVTYVQEWCGKSSNTRSRKFGEFFPTFEAAREYLIADLERRLQILNDERNRVIGEIKEARAIAAI